MQRLINKQIVLGITGGIAAYKSADLARRIREAGADVRIVMTENAKQFITPLTMQAVSGNPVHDNLFDVKAEAAMGHIELARWADVILVAPASADFISRLIHGDADDLLTTLCLASNGPIALAPAMNQAMWKNTFTQENVKALQAKGIHILGPGEGSQACGDVGPGRMLEPLELLDRTVKLFAIGSLEQKKVVITAGPTREAIDPVRFISNGSSGKMGYAIAEAAALAGAEVTLISGPVALAKPKHIKTIDVVSADDMLRAVQQHMIHCDIFFSVAAVSDYRPRAIASQKIAKKEATLTLQLEHTPDIVALIAAQQNRPLIIGFAAETNNLIEHARTKLINKKMDMIIANQLLPDTGFGHDENAVTVLWQDQRIDIAKTSKQKLAQQLIEIVAKTFLEEVHENSV